ncbi:Lrp/AsnC family transcriptional regulator [Paenibacillus sp. FSL W8-0194]|uniref:Lrp/AsnC family transcriptional regulator n=1 Tax=Paenibacillus sp. FSL W8-0194 TaxID=2921711 RepID=UPI0030DAF0E3
MDQTDLKILNILQDNARITISELGRMINMTGPAVTERVRRLEEKGVIRSYRAMLSPEKLGKAITAFVAIQANRCDLFTDFCRRSPDVAEVHQISGQFNFLIKVVTESMQSLDRFRKECSEYGFTQTMTVLSTPFDPKGVPLDV